VNAVRAPMPGNILDIAVKPGNKVSFRQPLCSLEAMKMKNVIRSPRDGVIARVEVSDGQAVSHGDVLFTFE
jgi:biotin carboxyl carrier protein